MNARGHIISGALLALASTGTFAAELNAGTIHFTGQIIEPSCEIQGDDGTSEGWQLERSETDRLQFMLAG